MSPTWSTSGDWDSPQSETGVHHEQPTGTDWAASDTLEKGYPTSDTGGSSLEGYWPFDEDSGTTANDVSGNGYDGTITGATLGSAGVLGTTAFSFDGTDDEVDIPDNAYNILGTGGFTLNFWANTPKNDTFEAFTACRDTGNNEDVIKCQKTASNTLKLYVQDGGGSVSTVESTTSDWSANTWTMLTFRFNADTNIRVYVDGSLAESLGMGGNTTVENPTTYSWLIANSDTQGEFLTGEMTDVRLYSRALSDTEITNLYQAAI